MPYPVLLGLDWLKQHNPAIDWTHSQLALSCCGANHNFPVSAFGKGYGLASPSVSDLLSVSSLGLGLCLQNPPPISKYSLPNLTRNYAPKPETFVSRAFANYSSLSSILCPLLPNGLSWRELKSIWLSPLSPPLPFFGPPNKPIDISIVSPERFTKYSKNKNCYCIWYTSNQDLDIRINSLSSNEPAFPSTHPSPNPSPPPEPSFCDYQPPVQQVTHSSCVVHPPPPKDNPWEGGNVMIDPLLLAVCFRLPPSGSFGLLLDSSYFRF